MRSFARNTQPGFANSGTADRDVSALRNRGNRLQTCVAVLLAFASCGWADPPTNSRAIELKSVGLALIQDVDVSAREQGVLASIVASEGHLVKAGDVLATIDDTDAVLELQRMQTERAIAAEEAQNDVNVRFARKSVEVAKAEFARAQEAVERYKKSVSATELDRLRLTAERAALQVEQSQHELKTAKLTLEAKANACELAARHVERHKIRAPISGMVVQVHHQQGEWVEPGDSVIRILEIDRLRAKGFLQAQQVTTNLVGRPATLIVLLDGRQPVEFPGRIVFVSPEINLVNNQVDVWAEIENRDLLLRPGLKGDLHIHAAEPTTAEIP